jgi:hypothetical protein
MRLALGQMNATIGDSRNGAKIDALEGGRAAGPTSSSSPSWRSVVTRGTFDRPRSRPTRRTSFRSCAPGGRASRGRPNPRTGSCALQRPSCCNGGVATVAEMPLPAYDVFDRRARRPDPRPSRGEEDRPHDARTLNDGGDFSAAASAMTTRRRLARPPHQTSGLPLSPREALSRLHALGLACDGGVPVDLNLVDASSTGLMARRRGRTLRALEGRTVVVDLVTLPSPAPSGPSSTRGASGAPRPSSRDPHYARVFRIAVIGLRRRLGARRRRSRSARNDRPPSPPSEGRPSAPADPASG